MLFRSNSRGWTAGLAAVALLTGAEYDRLAGDDKPAAREEKKSAVDPKDVRVGPPPELAELRKAVEGAAKAGENVEEIRKQLDALEKALAGRAWVKPKPVDEPPAPPVATPAPAKPFDNRVPQGRFPQPLVIGRGLDGDIAQLQAELLRQQADMLRGLQPDLILGGRGGLPAGRAGRIEEARFGVRFERLTTAMSDQLDLPAGRGLVVTEVRAGSAADRAGVKVNDVIVEFAGRPVTDDAAEFIRSVDAAPKDRKVDLTVIRKGKKETFKGVELPDAPRRGAEVPPVAIARALPRPDAAIRPRAATVEGLVSVRITDDAFTLTAEQDGVSYQIEGTTTGKVTVTKVVITSGDKKTEADSLEKVPAEYRKAVEKFIAGIRATTR